MILFAIFLISFGGAANAAHTEVSFLSEKEVIAPGESFDVGILLRMDPHWHTYWKDPGDSGIATSVEWNLPEGFSVGPIRWPKPEVLVISGLKNYVYENEVMLLVEIKAPEKGFKIGQEIKFEANVSWLECEKACIPGRISVSKILKMGKVSLNASAETLALFEKYRKLIPPDNYHPSKTESSTVISKDQVPSFPYPAPSQKQRLWVVIVFAFIGGMVLNIMPCVLPIIAIKILGFVRQSHDEPARVRRLGVIFGFGVLVSFWILAAIVLILRSAGSQAGWGTHLNAPGVQIPLALIMTFVALNLFGVFEFELGSTATQTAGSLASREGYTGSFFNGVLATTLATPCTGPFLAPALGFAFTQPAFSTVSVFTFVGLGFSFPYILLAWQPGLLKWMPKPGAWMVRFKEAMGFPILATALWLVWNLGTTAGHDAASLVLGWLLLSSFAVWFVSILASKRLSWIMLTFGLMVFLGYTWVYPTVKSLAASAAPSNSAHSGIGWQPFSKETLVTALKTSRPVFIDFESQACLTCKLNKPAFADPRVIQRFKDLDVIPLNAWWTQMPGERDEVWEKREKEIGETLAFFNRAGVPLYVIYPADRNQSPFQLPDGVIGAQTILKGLDRAVAKN